MQLLINITLGGHFLYDYSQQSCSIMASPLLRLTHDNFETNVERIFNQLRNDQTFSIIKLWRHSIYVLSEESALQWLDANPHGEAKAA